MRGVCSWPKTLHARLNSTVPPQDTPDLAQQLRNLMRSCAQPVAVASTRLNDADHSLHGATLSSFSSIALHPLPLVAFSVRQPSRLADALHLNRQANPDTTHGAINVLAAHQSQLAVQFSRPDLYPKPFLSATYRLEHGFPVFEEIIGTFLFSVLTSLPLSAKVLEKFGISEANQAAQEKELSSELFIARITRVLAPEDDPAQARKPLVYYQGNYTSVGSTEQK
ncbi:hypothetical protein FS749_001888 [Ceratobasidium sp. UAMH 11750]|nr:hypothetical protein FS749_001888 [Ceratobasidium sp. UAMH 11750]